MRALLRALTGRSATEYVGAGSVALFDTAAFQANQLTGFVALVVSLIILDVVGGEK